MSRLAEGVVRLQAPPPGNDEPGANLVIGLVASPGAATELADELLPDLAERIDGRLPDGQWTVRLVSDLSRCRPT